MRMVPISCPVAKDRQLSPIQQAERAGPASATAASASSMPRGLSVWPCPANALRETQHCCLHMNRIAHAQLLKIPSAYLFLPTSCDYSGAMISPEGSNMNSRHPKSGINMLLGNDPTRPWVSQLCCSVLGIMNGHWR